MSSNQNSLPGSNGQPGLGLNASHAATPAGGIYAAVYGAVRGALESREWPQRGDLDHMYFIGWAGGEWAKVGRSRNVLARRSSIQVGCPHRLEVVHTFSLRSDRRGEFRGPVVTLEGVIHRALVGVGIERGSGGDEWFRVAPWTVVVPVLAAVGDWSAQASGGRRG